MNIVPVIKEDAAIQYQNYQNRAIQVGTFYANSYLIASAELTDDIRLGQLEIGSEEFLTFVHKLHGVVLAYFGKKKKEEIAVIAGGLVVKFPNLTFTQIATAMMLVGVDPNNNAIVMKKPAIKGFAFYVNAQIQRYIRWTEENAQRLTQFKQRLNPLYCLPENVSIDTQSIKDSYEATLQNIIDAYAKTKTVSPMNAYIIYRCLNQNNEYVSEATLAEEIEIQEEREKQLMGKKWAKEISVAQHKAMSALGEYILDTLTSKEYAQITVLDS